MKAARFSALQISGLDFAASAINEATIRTLRRYEFNISDACAPPKREAFCVPKPVEALWKQDDEKSLLNQKLPPVRQSFGIPKRTSHRQHEPFGSDWESSALKCMFDAARQVRFKYCPCTCRIAAQRGIE
jgi:hypothetical protein